MISYNTVIQLFINIISSCFYANNMSFIKIHTKKYFTNINIYENKYYIRTLNYLDFKTN